MFVHRNDNCRKGLTVFSFFGKRIESVQTHKICFFGNAICFKRFAVILLYVGEHRIASFFLVLHAFFITELRGIRNAENCAVSISNYFHQTQMLFRVARYGAFFVAFRRAFSLLHFSTYFIGVALDRCVWQNRSRSTLSSSELFLHAELQSLPSAVKPIFLGYS